ncbi:hypothetical protein NA57DRAFT_70301 [Rhizodiscina lignyota]|uniref:Uncharacterized protein n=1 Tax=Rhizodiscina lignyota TaxID=1504668 RepID=A0A9P4IQT8_9PEZI|nr:hypothetical protein NA57DRAFT_70301 [Rhizodiscina lignyota]
MQFSVFSFAALLAASSVLAIPAASATSSTPATVQSAPATNLTAELETDVAKGAQSCKAVDFLTEVTYNVHIGEPFKQSHCSDTKKKLNAANIIGSNAGFGCHKTRKHHMFITFETGRGHGGKINKIFDNEFPEVNGFNCPNF